MSVIFVSNPWQSIFKEKRWSNLVTRSLHTTFTMYVLSLHCMDAVYESFLSTGATADEGSIGFGSDGAKDNLNGNTELGPFSFLSPYKSSEARSGTVRTHV